MLKIDDAWQQISHLKMTHKYFHYLRRKRRQIGEIGNRFFPCNNKTDLLNKQHEAKYQSSNRHAFFTQ